MARIRPVGGLRPSRGYQSNRLVEALVGRMGGECYGRDLQIPRGANLYVQHGFKLNPGLRSAIESRIPFVILDHGYFDPRIDKFSISINGFHGLSMKVDEIEGLPKRPRPLIQDWREPGEYVYVFGQLPGDRACRGQNMETWPTKTAQDAAEAFLRPAKVRPHPKMLSSWEKPLAAVQSVWEECHVAVTWTSTVAVQAVIAGVPVVALHPANPAYDVAAHDFARMRMPGRSAWLHDLSYRQYGFDELDEAIAYIQLGYPKAAGLAAAGEYDTIGLRV